MDLTFVKRLDADRDEFKAGMSWNRDFLLFVVGGGHPEGKPSPVD